MKKIIMIFLIFLITAFVYAEEYGYISDGAGLFDEAQETAINEKCAQIYNSSGTQVYIFTEGAVIGKTPETFLNDYYDSNFEGKDAALIIIDMKANIYRIQTYEDAQKLIDIDIIYKETLQSLNEGDYFSALEISLDDIEKGMEGYYVNHKNFAFVFIALAAGAMLSLIILGIMLLRLRPEKETVFKPRISSKNSRLLFHNDVYLKTLKSKAPKNSKRSNNAARSHRRNSNKNG